MHLLSSFYKLRLVIAWFYIFLGLSSVAFADVYADVSSLVKSKQYADALSKADQFLSTKPRDPQMRFIKGVIQSEMGKQSEATSTFTRLTEDYPELPEPYNNLAVIYANSGQYDKARSALEMAIRTNPSYSIAHENLGDIYAKLASQAYAKALQLDASASTTPAKLALIRELFSPMGTTKLGQQSQVATPSPANTTPSAPLSNTHGVNPVVAPMQPKQPTAVIASPTNSNQPSVAPAVVVNALANQEITAAVLAWAKAWSERDMKNYIGSYVKDYSANAKQSSSAWQEERRVRIMGKPRISVKLTEIQVTLSPNGTAATVKFKQDYKADSLAVNSRKVLEMVKSGSRWLITKEIAG